MLQLARKKHILPSDRTWHELRKLTQAFGAFGSYDQLNLVANAGIEIMLPHPGYCQHQQGAGQGGLEQREVLRGPGRWRRRRDFAGQDEAEIENALDRARAMQCQAMLTGDAAPRAPPAKDWPKPKGNKQLGGKGAGGDQEG